MLPAGSLLAKPDKAAADVPNGSRLAFFSSDNKQTYKVKIDTTKKPHRITMTPQNGGKTQTAILKVEKGELFLATARGRDAKAPADFEGDGVAILIMTRDKK